MKRPSHRGDAFSHCGETVHANTPNIKPAFLSHLADKYGTPVSAEDVMAYLAAVLSHPDFTERFSKDLKQPGLRVPITADPNYSQGRSRLGAR